MSIFTINVNECIFRLDLNWTWLKGSVTVWVSKRKEVTARLCGCILCLEKTNPKYKTQPQST